MATSKPRKYRKLEDLYKCHWFFGELSEENAKEILIEAMRKNEKSEAKSILFLKTVLWMPSGQKHFKVVSGHICGEKWRHDHNHQPQIYFHENLWCSATEAVNNDPFVDSAMRNYPFSLEELALVKTSEIKVETLKLPEMIKDKVEKYQALNDNFIRHGVCSGSKCMRPYDP